jgi:hypothetical protein
MEHLLKLRASSKLFGYKALHQKAKALSVASHYGKHHFNISQASIASKKEEDEKDKEHDNSVDRPWKPWSRNQVNNMQSGPNFTIQPRAFHKIETQANLIPDAKNNPAIARNIKTIANIRLGMENSLHTKDQRVEVINRLNHRVTKNLSPSHALAKIDSLNSSNIKKMMSNAKNDDKIDTERRRQE